MPDHEHDAITEYHVIGEGAYSNLRVAEVFEDEDVVAITPVSMPIKMLVATNIVFVLFGVGFYLLIHFLAPDERVLAALGAGGVMLLACVAFTVSTVYSVRTANRLGPWLIYEKTTGRVILPRGDLSFNADQVVCLQLITSKIFHLQTSKTAASELNLIIEESGNQVRHHLLRDSATSKPLHHIIQAFLDSTSLPVMRYRKRRGKPVDIQDMRTADLGWDLYMY